MKLGFFGGGQLACFLAQAADRLGHEVSFFCSSTDEPGARLGKQVWIGNISHPDFQVFLQHNDRILFENEFLPPEFENGVKSYPKELFYPQVTVIQRLSDKLQQKMICREAGVATPQFEKCDRKKPLPAWLGAVAEKFPNGFVLKWSRLGYDGKGVKIVRNTKDIVVKPLVDFCELAFEKGSEIFAEELVPFIHECAVVRTENGPKSVSFPLVLSFQDEGVCLRVFGPASQMESIYDRKSLAPLESMASSIAGKIAKASKIEGSFAVEFFVTQDLKLLVNEIAPRVHNTAHYTIDAANVSQFEAHIRAATGMDVPKLETKPFFMMMNLLGPHKWGKSLKRENTERFDLPIKNEKIKLHWYRKLEIREKRKLGHINAWADDLNELADIAEQVNVVHRQVWEAWK